MANKKNDKNIMGDMPHSVEAEQALLGCLLLDPQIQIEVAAFLKESDFYAQSNRYIFSAMTDIIKSNKPVDIVTLTDALEKQGVIEQVGGITYIAELTNVIPSSANYQHYLDIVKRDSTLRKLINGSAEIISNSKQATDMRSALEYAEKVVYDIGEEQDTRGFDKIGTIVPEVFLKLEELSNDQSKYRGIRTMYRGLDNLIKGVHKSDLMILAARPAVGKTSFAMNLVEKIAFQGYTCAVFSLEMGKDQIAQRLLCSVANVNMEKTLSGKLDKKEWLQLNRARELLADKKIYIDDTAATTPREILSKCRRLKRTVGSLDFVVVDYLQLMASDGNRKDDNRQQQITEISRGLKIMAKELNVPVLALSQLSRAVETRKGRPQLSDLRESGAIEQDADIVMFIHRPDKSATEEEIASGKVKKNIAEIIVEKHRNGPTGIVELYFKGECTKFLNYNKDADEVVEEDEIVKSQPIETEVTIQEASDAPFDVTQSKSDDPIF